MLIVSGRSSELLAAPPQINVDTISAATNLSLFMDAQRMPARIVPISHRGGKTTIGRLVDALVSTPADSRGEGMHVKILLWYQCDLGALSEI